MEENWWKYIARFFYELDALRVNNRTCQHIEVNWPHQEKLHSGLVTSMSTTGLLMEVVVLPLCWLYTAQKYLQGVPIKNNPLEKNAVF